MGMQMHTLLTQFRPPDTYWLCCHYYDNSYSSVYSDQIFQLSWNDEGNLEWSTMSQKSKFKRRASVVMMIPDELTTCT